MNSNFFFAPLGTVEMACIFTRWLSPSQVKLQRPSLVRLVVWQDWRNSDGVNIYGTRISYDAMVLDTAVTLQSAGICTGSIACSSCHRLVCGDLLCAQEFRRASVPLAMARFVASFQHLAIYSKFRPASSLIRRAPIFPLRSPRRRSANLRSFVLSERRNCLPALLTNAYYKELMPE